MNAGHLSPTARQVIAAVERLQTDRARLRSLLAEVADTSIDAGPDAGAIVALPLVPQTTASRPPPSTSRRQHVGLQSQPHPSAPTHSGWPRATRAPS